MKKIIKVAFVVVFAAIAGYDVYASQTENPMSDLMQANEKVLTDGEQSLCPNGCIANGSGCACNGAYYPKWQEYDWGD